MLSVEVKRVPGNQVSLHATTVTFNEKALVLVGPSGVGKSSLALRMMALGASLLADDVTWLAATDDGVEARCPPNLEGKIEARGFGVLRTRHSGPTPVFAIVDLGTAEVERMPVDRTISLHGYDIPLHHTPSTSIFAEILIHYLQYGRYTSP